MISLKKYLDSAKSGSDASHGQDENDILSATIDAYGSALLEMGRCGLEVCPALGKELNQNLTKLNEKLSVEMTRKDIEITGKVFREHLQDWSQRTSRHFQQRTGEVKEMLIVMARTAESVGLRDRRCAVQINEVTTKLKGIANLDDLTMIRSSIEKSAEELRTSVERMTEEGKAAIAALREEVANYQAKLVEAEYIASSDALTGLRSRLYVENQIEQRIASRAQMCVAIIDIDGFKKVNDDHGHLSGDELLKQFGTEIKTVCRSTDIIGRWGGDEFILLLDCGLLDARAKVDQLLEWVCGDYKINGRSGHQKFRVEASIGLAEYIPSETMNELLTRADAAMYRHKGATRSADTGTRRQVRQ
jgi:diguanylate cyclase (GGDEF)-like protein